MQMQTWTIMTSHTFMFLWRFRLLCNFIVILSHVFLWVAVSGQTELNCQNVNANSERLTSSKFTKKNLK